MRRSFSVLAVLLLLALPALAGDCDNPIRNLTAPDGVTGAPLRLLWNLGGVIPQSLTLSGHDFEEPVILNPGQTSFVYVPEQPGQKHATLTVVTECGTFTREVKYHVQQCNVAAPILTVDQTAVVAGGTVTASVELPPGHTARWVVRNGTPSTGEGSSIQVTAGTSGLLRIDVFVKRGDQSSNSCEVRATRSIPIQPACSINEPIVDTFPAVPSPSSQFHLSLPVLGPDETATFTVTGANVLYMGPDVVGVDTPATGTFSIDITISRPGCSKTFPHTWEVVPCEPTATVSVAPGSSCGQSTVAVDFTGTAPFQGYWSDGQFFYTMSSRLERTVTTGGTYTLSWFSDARCTGTVTGSADVAGALPQPVVAIDDMANGWWYGAATCPGLVRTAYLQYPAPAGAEVVWSIENGTILSGQGTGTIEWSGTNPGSTSITAIFRTADGCASQPHTIPYIVTQGVPSMSVSVEPSTIDLGQTAMVTVTRNNDFVSGWSVTSSLGDLVQPLGPIDERTYQYEYRSSQGAGVATIAVQANNVCGESSTAETTLTINQGAPVQATATIRQYGSTCADYVAIAELTGVAPFSGTWSNGQTFTSDYPYAFLSPAEGGTYTLTQFSDANGPGVVTGSATFDFVQIPAPTFVFSTDNACPNATVTATITSAIPDGATIEWSVYGGTIVSGEGTGAIEILTGDYGVNVNVKITSPAACSPWGFNYLPVTSYVMQPGIEAYGVDAGGTANVWVYLDPNTATWAFENSMGDPMEIVENPYPNYYVLRYTSTHGQGDSIIRVYGTTSCGIAFESTRVMTVWPPAPTATLTTEPSGTCYAKVTATLGGIAPFTVVWSDGETVTTSDTVVTKLVQQASYVSLSVTDATGRVGFSNQVEAQPSHLPSPSIEMSNYQLCSNGTITLTATGIPEGASVQWYLNEPYARIISGQGTSQIVIEGVSGGWIWPTVYYTTPEGCSSNAGAGIEVVPVAASPVITLPATSIAAGETLDFTVAFDGFNYLSLNWETSNGDPIAYLSQDGMTFSLRYISANGAGTATIRAYGTTTCGQEVEATATLTINP